MLNGHVDLTCLYILAFEHIFVFWYTVYIPKCNQLQPSTSYVIGKYVLETNMLTKLGIYQIFDMGVVSTYMCNI